MRPLAQLTQIAAQLTQKGRADDNPGQKTTKSDVESEQNHISVFHDIFLAFGTHKTFFFCRRGRAARNKIVKRNDLRAYKAAFKVGMYFTCRLRSFGALFYCPCTDFLRPCGKETYKSEKLVASRNKYVKTAVFSSGSSSLISASIPAHMLIIPECSSSAIAFKLM